MQPYVLNCNTDPYEAGSKCTHPYTIVGCPVIRFISLKGCCKLRFYPFSDALTNIKERSNSTTIMPLKNTNRFPLPNANQRESGGTIRKLLGHGTSSLATRIQPFK
jgi:hypothetical protein